MLLRGSSFLNEARQSRRAVPAFVVYNMEMAQGIVGAAEVTGLPVMLIAGSSAFKFAGLRSLATLSLELARASSAPIGVHLDHCRSLDEIETCLALGYTSVMFDGSHLSYEENVALTQTVVASAHEVGAWVEAELVGVVGDEDVSTDAVATSMTNPQQAREFVQETRVDALSVAVGNVHGFSRHTPAIDLKRLTRIESLVDIPLVLHGASGLGDQVVLDCLDLGICKVNVNAELRRAYMDATRTMLRDDVGGEDLVSWLEAGRAAVEADAVRITRLLNRTS
jgi:ketose-bisphosphate aldolase